MRADHFPIKGETLIGHDFDLSPGGKGSNQAVQSARLGGEVEFVGLIGEESFGDIALKLYRDEGVGTKYLERTNERNTGVRFIMQDGAGDHRMILDPGANALLSPAHVDRAVDCIRASQVVMTLLEIPLETAAHTLRLARQADAVTILNPAPATHVPPEMLAHVDLVTPNETELRVLLGRAPDDPTDALDLCSELLQFGVARVILTRGARGALIVTPDGHCAMPAPIVNVVDSTGGGDAFHGTLAAALAMNLPLEPAVRRAVAAGAWACTKRGVIPALPRTAELERFLLTERPE